MENIIKPDTNHQSSNPIDLSKLRISPEQGNQIGVQKIITNVPVHNPRSQLFVRVNRDPEFQYETYVLDFKEDRETYLVDRPLWDCMPVDLVPKVLYGAITKTGNPFLWPVRLAGPDGKLSSWSQSAFTAVQMAKESWIRVVANMGIGGYDIFQATGNLPEPEWPNITMNELIQIAFRNRFITSLDHAVIKKLKGEQ